jgi:carbon-monoxide dehydrogenase small subunit
VVHLNGKAVKACTLVLWQIEGADVLTIEGVADPNGPLHPMQEAFREHHGLQCGYCTPGMLLTAQELLTAGGALSRDIIRAHLSGNYCRCTGYQAIIDAVEAVAQARAAAHAKAT